jgi:Protein of unknown function (DUF1360).
VGEARFWRRLVLAIFASWRITHLLAREDGPADVLARFRTRLGDAAAGKLMDCFHCISVWVSAPIALFVTRRAREFVPVWLAVSGAACLLERIGREPVIIQPATEKENGGSYDGMLRSEAGGAQKHRSASDVEDISG